LLRHDGAPIAKELIFVPVVEEDIVLGAAKLLAVLAFPEDIEKRNKMVDYIGASIIKPIAPQNSYVRKDYQPLTAIPNKKIEQFLNGGKKSAKYRLNMRCRAAKLFWERALSNRDFKHSTLKDMAEKAASVNSRYQPGFYGDDAADSFIKRILWTSKPVIHLAMAYYINLVDSKLDDERDIVAIARSADKWLIETLFLAEAIKVELKNLFPCCDNSRNHKFMATANKLELGNLFSYHGSNRGHHFSVALEDTIAVYPLIDKLRE
jgi:hypothetical protein